MSTDKAGTYKGYEQAPYQLVSKDGAFEIRDYQPVILAEVAVSGERDDAIGDGFRILANYIFGGNVPQAKIAMTTPVTQQARDTGSRNGEKIAMTTPVTQSGEGSQWMVTFMMPQRYTLDNLPKPKDERIKFRVAEPERRLVIRFSGFASERNLKARLQELEDHAKKHNLGLIGTPRYVFYDDPFTLPFWRRNEIAYTLAAR